jgi:hypothetical protein
MTDDHNVNLSKCIQDVTDFGVTHVHNICSGTVTDLPWGSADWCLALVISALGIAFIAMNVALAVTIIKDAF